MEALNSNNSLALQIKYIENHITYSTDVVYESILQIIDSNKNLNVKNLPQAYNFLNYMKKKYYQKTGYVPQGDR